VRHRIVSSVLLDGRNLSTLVAVHGAGCVAQGRKILRRNGYGSYLGLKRRGRRVRTMRAVDPSEASALPIGCDAASPVIRIESR
jgi:hypothetical protein